MKNNKKIRLICCVIILSLLVSSQAFAATKVSGSSLSQTGTPLDDFDYEIKGNTVRLNEYKGTDTDIVIEASYELNGKTYKTDLSRFMFGIFNDYPARAFISEGIEELYGPIFNSCKANEIYLPHSLTSLAPKVLSYFPHYDDNYNPVIAKIFYAGTQDEFEQLLIKGAGLTGKDAENVNIFSGFGFNASDFEFIFEATKEDFYSGEF